jgi:hypothetical protein
VSAAPIDPGYGDPRAAVGTEQWAKRWRLGFQSVALELPSAPERCMRYYAVGVEHRAWTLLTDGEGRAFADFDSFCACPQPYGLGTDPAKFRLYYEAEVGKKAADLATVAPGEDKGGRPSNGEETGTTVVQVSEGMSPMKAKNLRAILRAPELAWIAHRG